MGNDFPEILAPAGDEDCFLAALAAGADAIYLGLKQFSARMEAKNFGMSQLARLIDLAHQHGRRVYVAMNTLIKPNEIDQAYRLVRRLTTQACADGIIFQDLAIIDLAKQAGFTGMLALSTLANVSTPKSLLAASSLGVNRVILPRELSLDEIRCMGDACPPDIELECFIHGALCYCISGRCYWSSYLGGKSSLRGRCVQPCRRMYARLKKNQTKGAPKRLFSCQDLEIGPLIKTLLTIHNLKSWKIEGRKKGPHYVYNITYAYRILRDHQEDSQYKNMALEIIKTALGRPGCKAGFLPHRVQMPMSPDGQTSSGLFIGKVNIDAKGVPNLKTRHELLVKDLLRIGVEDESWHSTLPIRRHVPRNSAFKLELPKHKTPKSGTSVYLIDRREPEFEKIISEWKKKLAKIQLRHFDNIESSPVLPKAGKLSQKFDMIVQRKYSAAALQGQFLKGMWINSYSLKIHQSQIPKIVFWLPPDLWGDIDPEKIINQLLSRGAKNFVCNAPWQVSLFARQDISKINLIAGPFCNITNSCAIGQLSKMGFKAAFVSPELSQSDFLSIPEHSPLPLGVVLGGFWPVGLSRFGLCGITPQESFKSPKGEIFWIRNYNGTIWVYPSWPIDLKNKWNELKSSGYSFYAILEENPPEFIPVSSRPGVFNWEGNLL